MISILIRLNLEVSQVTLYFNLTFKIYFDTNNTEPTKGKKKKKIASSSANF